MASALGCAFRTVANRRDPTVPARRVALPAVPIASPELPAGPMTLLGLPRSIAPWVGSARTGPADRSPDSVRGSGGYGSTGGHALLLDGTN